MEVEIRVPPRAEIVQRIERCKTELAALKKLLRLAVLVEQAQRCRPKIDPDLARVIDTWPALPEPIRRAILALIGSRE